MLVEAAQTTSGKRVYVSYRRRDSPGAAGRLCDGLVAALGEATVTRGSSTLHPGAELAVAFDDALAGCAVLLVVIGPRWVDDPGSVANASDPGSGDHVRLEIAAALRRNLTIVPVLVDGASMPHGSKLPAELAPIVDRQPYELSDTRWAHDVGQLVRHLAPSLDSSSTQAGTRPDMRVLVPSLSLALLLYGFALVWPVHTVLPIIDLDVARLTGDWFRLPTASDGGLLLGAGAAVAWLARILLSKYQEVLAGRFGGWLQDRRVFGAMTIGIGLALPPIFVGRWLFGISLLMLAFVVVLTRRSLDRALAAPRTAAGPMVVALSVLLAALGMDLWTDHERQAGYDVALLLPPLGAGVAAEQVFTDFRSALRIALAGTPVDIAPERLSRDDIQNLVIERPQRLLAYRGQHGPARVFIRVQYTLASGQLSLVVWPYVRAARVNAALVSAEGWVPPELIGPMESREIALRASFELIEFLVDKAQFRLDAASRQRVWRQVLEEYEQLIRLRRAHCADVIAELTALRGGNRKLDGASLRQALFASCQGTRAQVDPDADVRTARALWDRTFGR